MKPLGPKAPQIPQEGLKIKQYKDSTEQMERGLQDKRERKIQEKKDTIQQLEAGETDLESVARGKELIKVKKELDVLEESEKNLKALEKDELVLKPKLSLITDKTSIKEANKAFLGEDKENIDINRDNQIKGTNKSLFSKKFFENPIKHIKDVWKDNRWNKLQTTGGKIAEIGGAIAGGVGAGFLGAGALAPVTGPLGALVGGGLGLALGAWGGRKLGGKIGGQGDEQKMNHVRDYFLGKENSFNEGKTYSLSDLDHLLNKSTVQKRTDLFEFLKTRLGEEDSKIEHLQYAKHLLGAGFDSGEYGNELQTRLKDKFGLEGYKALLEAKEMAPKKAKEGIDNMLKDMEGTFKEGSLMNDPTLSEYHPLVLANDVNDLEVLKRLGLKEGNNKTDNYLLENSDLVVSLMKDVQKEENEDSKTLLNRLLGQVETTETVKDDDTKEIGITEAGLTELGDKVQSGLLSLGKKLKKEEKLEGRLQEIYQALEKDNSTPKAAIRWLKTAGKETLKFFIENKVVRATLTTAIAGGGTALGALIGGPIGAPIGTMVGGLGTDLAFRVLKQIGNLAGIVDKKAKKTKEKNEEIEVEVE